ncbi:MAG: zf-HC2 domain-containing protein, partial [Candidatus Eremiobacteraeota bacterium]|nr:zf-HC2 domain-containing protein [Candidatus Eremiobacteraeota bacterium]
MKERGRHVGEEAELYALGMLDDRQRAAVEAHLAECTACSRRVGEAEETVLALERRSVATPIPFARRLPLKFERRRISAWWLAPAAAAALIVGLLLPRPASNENAALLAMINSHFSHAQFAGATGPPAKVLYARDRSWYYVIVTGIHRYDVYGIHAGVASDLGTTSPGEGTNQLFVRTMTRFDRLELR